MGMAIATAAVDDVSQGCCLAESGQYDGAVQCFKRATGSDQAPAEVHEMLAQCLLETGAHEEALQAASAAVSLRPEVTGRQCQAAADSTGCLHLTSFVDHHSGGPPTSRWPGRRGIVVSCRQHCRA